MSVQVAIDERIEKHVEARRAELELLVDQALERELAQLVQERIAASNGGPTSPQKPPVAPSEPAAKVCNRCRRSLPASSFDRYRNTCKRCTQE